MPLVPKPIVIGARAWVAAGAFVGPGVTVGEGVVVGARSCVNRDVAAWTVVAGNPARELKQRVLADAPLGQSQIGNSSSMNQPTIAAIVLTKNEERDLPGCLESLRGLATEVYVIDSGSTDRTTAIAEEYGARLLSHPFTSYAPQFNWALDNVSSTAQWVLRIDADERISDRLRVELLAACARVSEGVCGLLVPRRIRFLGRDIRYGDTYPVWLLRVWRNGEGRCEDAWMDEHVILRSGIAVRVAGDLIHEIPKDLGEWTAKHNWYASRECQDIQVAESLAALYGQAGKKRWLKQNVYLRFPPCYRAFFYWFYRYFAKLGFLDGKEGLIYHFLQGFWYRFLVDARLHEARRTSRQAGAGASGKPTRAASM
jgi:glycosyltransferase involved in cell wall biosynthesis